MSQPKKEMKINIRFVSYQVEATLFDTPTGRAVHESLPIKRNVITWGEEIYVDIPVKVDLEQGAQAEVEIGDLAYWPNMPAFCIFFGRTPASTGDKPRAASPVNVFGKLDTVDLESLRNIPEGENLTIERAD